MFALESGRCRWRPTYTAAKCNRPRDAPRTLPKAWSSAPPTAAPPPPQTAVGLWSPGSSTRRPVSRRVGRAPLRPPRAGRAALASACPRRDVVGEPAGRALRAGGARLPRLAGAADRRGADRRRAAPLVAAAGA